MPGRCGRNDALLRSYCGNSRKVARKLKRVLFVASVASHISAFHLPYIELLQDQGHLVEVACHSDVHLSDLSVWEIPFPGSPYSFRTLLPTGN